MIPNEYYRRFVEAQARRANAKLDAPKEVKPSTSTVRLYPSPFHLGGGAALHEIVRLESAKPSEAPETIDKL